ncbi:hypothetical protein [Flammeovirga sp. EKP202]|uniref:hypothetical protein n=1 Tax=Flammeovirga sp. EKP202 TaxID=2770592 RepID=UPI00165F035A|nr:hypothetical protein [Flammeovirga sp. EKP202]MBD0405312.1 hypothetical protein [Flammeovirga sp. EKP202]
MIDFNSKIEIEELLAWMDGGSITLKCRDNRNQKFEIEFVQHVVWNVHERQNIPGRVYLDKKLITQRSNLEIQIINALKVAKFHSKDALDQNILKEKLDYINSEEYLTDQEKIKRVKRK